LPEFSNTLASQVPGETCNEATLVAQGCLASQLFGAEFTQVYACQAGRGIEPDKHAIRVETKEVQSPT
jgi:hypothetical protein